MAIRKEKERATAERLFIEDGWTAKAIADFLDLQENTVSKWRSQFEWDILREENLSAPHKIRKALMKEYQSLLDGNKPNFDADAVSKISKALESLQKTINPQVAIGVIKELDEFVAGQDTKAAVDMLIWHKLFIQHKIKNSD